MHKPINGWTKELIIEHIKTNFKGKSMGKGGIKCAYRGARGKKCSVGIFIPDKEYCEGMEGLPARTILMAYPRLKEHMPLSPVSLYYFQLVHDHTPNGVKKALIAWVKENVK